MKNVFVVAGLVFAILVSIYYLVTFTFTSSTKLHNINDFSQAVSKNAIIDVDDGDGDDNIQPFIEPTIKKKNGKIPPNIIFTYEYNILKYKTPPIVYENLKNTIDKYTTLWQQQYNIIPNVIFLSDKRCLSVIKKSYRPLLPYFANEVRGIYKGDICRIAALHHYGGYYFDVDMEVVNPLVVPSTVSFATAYQPVRKDFFQAFLASRAQHPILTKALRFMELHYNNVLVRRPDQLGTRTLKWAYDSVHAKDRGEVLLLEEIWVEHEEWVARYPSFVLQKGYGCCCNFVVHDPRLEEIYFYSRIVGFSERCTLEPQ